MYPVLLVASLVVFVGVSVAYLRQDFASIFHPITIYLLFHGLVFVVRPFFAYWLGYDNIYDVYGFVPSAETKAIVIICANLGMLAFVMAAWRTGNVPLVFRQDASDLAHRRRLIKPFLVVLALLAPIAAASLVYVYDAAWSTMRLDRATGIAVNTTANGWFVEAQLMFVTMAVLLAWVFRFRWWALVPLMAFVLLRAGTGGRGPFIVAAAAALLLWLYDRKRRWFSAKSVVLVCVMTGLFYVIGQDRNYVVKALADGGMVKVEQREGFMESMDFANLEFFEYIVETVPKKTGTYGYFVSNLQVFTEPIPRKLWRDKPIGAPIKLYNLFDYGYPIGMTFSLPGEGWQQAGYLGVILWCGLWGLALGAVYARFARSRQGNFHVALYFAFLPIFIIAFRDGLLITILRTAVFYLAPIFCWMVAARALGIPGPAEQMRRIARRRARSLASPERGPRRRHRFGPTEVIMPRAWRPRPGEQPAE